MSSGRTGSHSAGGGRTNPWWRCCLKAQTLYFHLKRQVNLRQHLALFCQNKSMQLRFSSRSSRKIFTRQIYESCVSFRFHFRLLRCSVITRLKRTDQVTLYLRCQYFRSVSIAVLRYTHRWRRLENGLIRASKPFCQIQEVLASLAVGIFKLYTILGVTGKELD